ncbi:MAG: four helix bundle protein [Balneolaceae bacterium]|nr:four helix bundle protein [Balneolaceae bacterium]
MSKNFRDLTVYKKAFNLAMFVFDLTKKFPSEEKYALKIRLDDHPDRSVGQLEKATEKGCIRNILLLK